MEGCEFKTDDVEGSVAAVMLTIHNNVHIAKPTPGTSDVATRHRAPKLKGQKSPQDRQKKHGIHL